MITISDIGEILFDKCKPFSLPTYIKGSIPLGEVTEERICILPMSIEDGKYWCKCSVKVNWCVPDVLGERSPRIKDAEKALESLYYGQGTLDGAKYKYKKSSVSVEQNSELRCHFVNLSLLFYIQKVL